MKLSTRGRYGIRLMLELALRYGSGPIRLKEIAEQQKISEKYLWQLLAPLKKRGLVTATRGVNGGYALAKAPAEICLKEILRCLEGPLCLVDCVDEPSLCDRSPSCIFRDLWRKISREMTLTLEKTTLAAMVAQQEEKSHAEKSQ